MKNDTGDHRHFYARNIRLRDWLHLWAVWVLVTTAGWTLGVIFGFALAYLVLGPPIDSLESMGTSAVGYLFGLIISGVLLGLGQWWVIQRVGVGAAKWTLATVAGATVDGLGCIVTLAMRLVEYGLGGIGVGIGQWVLLRRGVRNAVWWIPANIVAWTVGVYLGARAAYALQSNHLLPQQPLTPFVDAFWLTLLVVSGFVRGAVTGAVLVILLAYQMLLTPSTAFAPEGALKR
jgi:hypothetical protein